MLARALRLGAAAILPLCVLVIPLSAQNAPPALSLAERRAALEQGLQLWQAARYPEAFSTFMKAGNAGERRASALAAIALEEGAGIAARPDSAALWHVVAATGGQTPNLPVDIEWLGDGAIRYHVKPNHQRVTVRADGSWTRELLHERIRVKEGAVGLEGYDATEYVITEDLRGHVTVTDWRGNWWSLNADSPEDRLTRDERTGDLTFVDDLKRTVTIRPTGRRTIARDTGNARRLELDAGGRLVGIYDAAGKATNQYQHDYRGQVEPVMSRFINPQGALWGMTLLPGGGQRWTLLNGDDPKIPVTMDVGIRVNRANSLVFVDRQKRRIDTGDGTKIDESRRQESGGVWVTEKKVGSGDKVAYTLLTYERGSVFKQELTSRGGRLIRGDEGQDFASASWWEVDGAGRRKPGTAWAGDIFIDDDGTLIKQGYASEPDPRRPGDVRAHRDARGARLVEAVTSIFTSGESEQRFAHGGLIRRDFEGTMLWTTTPGGEMTRYYYGVEGKDKFLVAMREGASPRWKWLGHWSSRAPAKNNFATGALVNTTVNRRSGDAEWKDDDRKAVTTYRVDGSRRYVVGPGTYPRIAEVDAQGRPTRFLAPSTPEVRLYYAADGRLERVDHPDGPGPSIVESTYQAPPTLPLSAKEIWRGTKLELLGWGDDRYVSFLDGKGHRVDFWSGGTVVEHDGEASAPLVRVTLRNYFTIVKRGHETSSGAPSDRVTVAERIEGLSGAGWDQSVVYVDAQGRRGQRFASGARSEFDAAGRLVRHTDERNRVFELGYAKDGSLESAATPDRRVRRGSLSDGVRDFRLTPSGALVLIRDSGLEMYGFPGGRRITIGPDGTLSKYDHRDRLSYEERLDGARALLIYDSDTASSAARKQEVAGAKRPREAVATLDIALDQGRLRTLERSVKGRDGKPTRTVIVRADRGEWIDDEQNRYAAAWIGQNPRRVVLVTGDGRLMRVVHDDGGETRVGYDEHYERRFGVTRNARGEVVNVQHADWSVTRFERNDSGRVTMLQRGPDVVVFNSKNSPAGFEPSISPRSRWPVSLQVDGQGTQIWSGKSGLQRTVAPDGRIEVSRPDGSKTFFLADGGRRHVFPARAGATLSEVTEHQNGDIEWVLSDGSAGRYADHGLVTESLKKDRTPALDGQGRPLRSRGYAAVTPRGDLTLLDLDRGTLVVRHADGRVTEFQSAGAAGWRAPDTGEVFASWGEIQQRLTAIGAATPGHSSRHLDLAEVEGANRIRLTLGMFEYEAPAIEPPRRPAPLATRSQRERAITSVMLNPGGTPQIGYASSAQPPPNRSR